MDVFILLKYMVITVTLTFAEKFCGLYPQNFFTKTALTASSIGEYPI